MRRRQEVTMRYETTTRLDSAEALAAAERFFAGKFGIAVRTRGPQMIGFAGGGGHVVISVAGERPTILEVETREWDTAVVEFMGKLPR
jgi:hypothetical protein